MAMLKDPELSSSHRHTESTAIYRKISFEINHKTGCMTAIHWVNEENKPTLNWIVEAETQYYH